MKTLALGLVGLVFVCVTLEASELNEAPMHTTPIQVSIWNPVQLVPEDWNVCGLRLNVPYGKNREVVGIDLGFANTAAAFEGVQLGIVNFDLGVGIHAHAPTDVVIDSKGVQIGYFNSCYDFAGVQIGGDNFAFLKIAGVQIAGSLNMADSFTGLQVAGLCNINMGEGRGVQIAGLWNHNGRVACQGVQLAVLVNSSSDMKGVQIGLVNIAGKMTGVQIGLANIIKDSPVPFCPIINAHF